MAVKKERRKMPPWLAARCRKKRESAASGGARMLQRSSAYRGSQAGTVQGTGVRWCGGRGSNVAQDLCCRTTNREVAARENSEQQN